MTVTVTLVLAPGVRVGLFTFTLALLSFAVAETFSLETSKGTSAVYLVVLAEKAGEMVAFETVMLERLFSLDRGAATVFV